MLRSCGILSYSSDCCASCDVDELSAWSVDSCKRLSKRCVIRLISSMALVCKLYSGHSVRVNFILFGTVDKVCVGWKDGMDDEHLVYLIRLKRRAAPPQPRTHPATSVCWRSLSISYQSTRIQHDLLLPTTRLKLLLSLRIICLPCQSMFLLLDLILRLAPFIFPLLLLI